MKVQGGEQLWMGHSLTASPGKGRRLLASRSFGPWAAGVGESGQRGGGHAGAGRRNSEKCQFWHTFILHFTGNSPSSFPHFEGGTIPLLMINGTQMQLSRASCMIWCLQPISTGNADDERFKRLLQRIRMAHAKPSNFHLLVCTGSAGRRASVTISFPQTIPPCLG